MKKKMGRKRKHAETITEPKQEQVAEERPKRTLLGWKEKPLQNNENEAVGPTFRNKEKVLVTCSRRIDLLVLESNFFVTNHINF